MAASPENAHFDESEIVAALQSVVSILEDPDPKKRACAYTRDATFVMPGAAPVHGREGAIAPNAARTKLHAGGEVMAPRERPHLAVVTLGVPCTRSG
jgi:hypothetical protein